MTVFNSEAEIAATADSMAKLAMTRGWWQYARHEVQRLEVDASGLYRGLRVRVAATIKEAGYRPEPYELQEMEPMREVHTL